MTGHTAERLYDEDFFAWTQHEARKLRSFARSRPNIDLDLAHIAEEIADLGKEQRNALRSWTARILEHLLLLEHSPAEEPRRGWTREILNFRNEIHRRLTPTLRRDLERRLPRLYHEARRVLIFDLEHFGEADVAAKLPVDCPYSLDQILGDHWPARSSA